MEKLRMESLDKVTENVRKVAALFPNCVTERRTLVRGGQYSEKSKTELVIDFDKLKQELSDYIVDGAEERYQFTWPDKKKAILTANSKINKTLRPCREESVNFDTTENLYIEGDNLEVLKLLQETYLGKVKMIYIDPPYNTGSDFVYRDDFSKTVSEFDKNSGRRDETGNRITEASIENIENPFSQNPESNGRFHTDWLNMMYPRLKLARDLLADDGVIFISIDEHESANLRKICDEILGINNSVGDMIWEATTQPINAGKAKFGLQQKTEVIYFYAKNKSKINGFILEAMETDIKYPHNGKYGKCRFEIIEKSDAGDYNRPTMKFKILGQYPREGKRWQIGEDTARLLEKEGKIEIVDGIVKKAVYPEDEKDKIQYKPFWSLLRAENVGTALNGKDELNTILSKAVGFDTVKSINLIKELLYHTTSNDDLILDFFSGSATTAHALMQLNAEDGGHRKFIMVQLPELKDEKSEAYKAGYKNICEIGKERIRRAGAKIKSEHPEAKDLDIGFRVLKCDSSNMKDVYYTPVDTINMNMFDLVDNVKEDRTAEDLLFQCMLEFDAPLSSAIETMTIGDKTVYNVAGGHLMACFDTDVTEEVITEVAKLEPSYFVMRDSSLASDSVAANFEQIFKTYSPSTERRVL